MTRGTTICCSAIALLTLAAAKPDTPAALVPTAPLWTLALNNAITAPPAYDPARVFFSIDHDRFVAYNKLTGAQLWMVDASPRFEPAAGDERVFLVEPDGLRALKAADGADAWRLPMAEPLAMRPVWDTGWLIGVTRTGTVLAFRAADGHLVWQRDLGVAAHAAPALAADRVYIPAGDGRIVALSVVDGTIVWERKIGGVPNEVLALHDRIYVGSTDNFFYCLLARDGRIDWRWRTGADVVGMPVADDRRVYFVSLDNVLRGMNQVSGAQEWLRALPVRPTSGPKLAGATLVVSGQSPTIRTFNVKDGVASAEINAGDEVAAPPHVLAHPVTALPMLLVTTRHLVRGAAATLVARTVEPNITPIAPLTTAIMPAPTLPTR